MENLPECDNSSGGAMAGGGGFPTGAHPGTCGQLVHGQTPGETAPGIRDGPSGTKRVASTTFKCWMIQKAGKAPAGG